MDHLLEALSSQRSARCLLFAVVWLQIRQPQTTPPMVEIGCNGNRLFICH
jgi:hypothetical protein